MRQEKKKDTLGESTCDIDKYLNWHAQQQSGWQDEENKSKMKIARPRPPLMQCSDALLERNRRASPA